MLCCGDEPEPCAIVILYQMSQNNDTRTFAFNAVNDYARSVLKQMDIHKAFSLNSDSPRP